MEVSDIVTEPVKKRGRPKKVQELVQIDRTGKIVIDTLDGYCTKIDHLIQETVANVWSLGYYFSELYNSGLWKKEEKDTSFSVFVRKRFNLSESSIYAYMKMAENYSEKEFKLFGPRVLRHIASFKKEDRKAILKSIEEDVEGGLSVNQAFNKATDSLKEKKEVQKLPPPQKEVDDLQGMQVLDEELVNSEQQLPLAKNNEIACLLPNDEPFKIQLYNASNNGEARPYKTEKGKVNIFGMGALSNGILIKATFDVDEEGHMFLNIVADRDE